MRNKAKQVITDESGQRWNVVRNNPCDNPFEPKKHKFTISFEVEFEIDLTVFQPQHEHVICTKEGADSQISVEQILMGDVCDFGKAECLTREYATNERSDITRMNFSYPRPNAIPDTPLNTEYTYQAEQLFRRKITYLKKHLPTRLKRVLTDISKQFDKKRPRNTSDKESERVEKEIRDAKEELRSQKKKINKKNVADLIHNTNTNPIQQLNRQLTRFFLDFEEI